MSRNNIAFLSPTVFKYFLADDLEQKPHLSKMKYLNLSRNEIQSFDLQEYFPLSRNSDTYGTIFELVSLDLSENRLDSLNTTSVNWLKQSKTLIYLKGNPWRCECSALQGAWKELRRKLTLRCEYPKLLEGQTWNVIGNMCYHSSLFPDLAVVDGQDPNTSELTPSSTDYKLLMRNNATDKSESIQRASLSITIAIIVVGVLLVCLLVGGGIAVVLLVNKSKKRSEQPEYWDVYVPGTDVSVRTYSQPYSISSSAL